MWLPGAGETRDENGAQFILIEAAEKAQPFYLNKT
jgi:hypothetical protein